MGVLNVAFESESLQVVMGVKGQAQTYLNWINFSGMQCNIEEPHNLEDQSCDYMSDWPEGV
ncbi:hypothetical protein Sjap_002673 [Stephania japonica]|uniref:Uncharacterized protein n=1 Tax=Stephania japonica TaxID=461633 RepID=A0AAP0KNV3_9MAGN